MKKDTPNLQTEEELECPFTIEWGLVSVKMAEDWLKNGAENRKLKQASIDTFTRDMLTGRWFPNHQGIAFDPEGRLNDGQNRLSAIVKSGRPQYMLIFRYKTLRVAGVEATAMETFDRGVSRSIADVLGLEHGMKQEANAVAAALLHIARICVRFPALQAHKSSVPQSVGVLRIFRPQMEWLIKVRCSTIGLRRVELIGTLAFAHAAMPREAAQFYEEVIAGNGSPGSPARMLHGALVENVIGLANWSLRSSADERKRSAGIVLALLRAHAAGEKLSGLPIERGPAALEWFHEQLREKVVECAALFPMVNPEPEIKRPAKAKPAPEAPRATRTFTAVPPRDRGEGATVAPPADVPVTRATDLRVTPAAARLLAAAGGGGR